LDIFKQAETKVSRQEFDSIGQALQTTLGVLQKVNATKSFGLCNSCSYFSVTENHYQCNLTEQALAREDTDKICREHLPFPNSFIDQEY
jgi:hypothetical protein